MNHNKTRSMMQGFPFRLLIATLLLSLVGQTARADEWFDVWNNSGQWDVVGDAMVAANNPRELIGKPGQGVLLNGKTGRAKSLVSKQTFQDVEVHVEFIVAKHANSGVSLLNLDPTPIRLQKHIVVNGENLGEMNPRPIEYRNIFIRELEPGAPIQSGRPPGTTTGKVGVHNSPTAELLAHIDQNPLPKAYSPAKHQDYVDGRMAELSGPQRHRISQLWQETQRLDPHMPNRGFSFVKIMEYVATRQVSN